MKHLLLIFFFCYHGAHSAPAKSKSKNLPQTVYDQKQTGDYNIQLHLKDFQIIALLADESLGSFGDYDYNYDYSDFTIKPNNFSSTTHKPADLSPPPPPAVTEKPVLVSSHKPSTDAPPSLSTLKQEESSSTITPNSPDKIKVQIIQGAESIVPSDDMPSNVPALGEILHYRRCASGFARDKRGRCRRVKRPSPSFDLGRLASNFVASRFRQAPAAISSHVEQEEEASSSVEADEATAEE